MIDKAEQLARQMADGGGLAPPIYISLEEYAKSDEGKAFIEQTVKNMQPIKKGRKP